MFVIFTTDQIGGTIITDGKILTQLPQQLEDPLHQITKQPIDGSRPQLNINHLHKHLLQLIPGGKLLNQHTLQPLGHRHPPPLIIGRTRGTIIKRLDIPTTRQNIRRPHILLSKRIQLPPPQQSHILLKALHGIILTLRHVVFISRRKPNNHSTQ